MVNLIRSELTVPAARLNFPVGSASKRVIDVVISAIAIVMLAPVLIVCFFAVALTFTGPVLYRHKRVGFEGKSFNCLKFRTMVMDSPERLKNLLMSDAEAAKEWGANQKLRNDPRVTTVGRILRKSSLDELPQLFNVLVGDMSIVGPRPITGEELKRYLGGLKDYYSCRPGITGLWQVSGRSTTSFRKRVACDSLYARKWTMMLDVKILVATIPAIFADTAF